MVVKVVKARPGTPEDSENPSRVRVPITQGLFSRFLQLISTDGAPKYYYHCIHMQGSEGQSGENIPKTLEN